MTTQTVVNRIVEGHAAEMHLRLDNVARQALEIFDMCREAKAANPNTCRDIICEMLRVMTGMDEDGTRARRACALMRDPSIQAFLDSPDPDDTEDDEEDDEEEEEDND